jgi:hypothetical protein
MPETDADLVRRALVNARARHGMATPNWRVAQLLFAVGSTSAGDICRRFGYDADGSEMTFSAPRPRIVREGRDFDVAMTLVDPPSP